MLDMRTGHTILSIINKAALFMIRSYHLMYSLLYSIIGLAVLFSGCAHNQRVLDARYETIHIPVIHNETPEFGLEERFTHGLIEAFRRDGQLRVVRRDDADLVLNARITGVEFFPQTFSDLDRAVGYRIHVVMMVDVIDNASGEPLFTNRPFQADGNFILSSSPTTAATNDVSATLAESILSRLIEGW